MTLFSPNSPIALKGHDVHDFPTRSPRRPSLWHDIAFYVATRRCLGRASVILLTPPLFSRDTMSTTFPPGHLDVRPSGMHRHERLR